MNNTKTTKRALLTSVMAMLLCITMLIGTTYAWFTDSASTGVNKIQAGTLDVGLEMKTGTDAEGNSIWANAEGETLGWVAADGRAQDQIFWEPGCTYTLPTLKITNKGNLALQFKILITNISGDLELLNALEFTCKYSMFEEYLYPVEVYTGTFEGTSLNNLPYEIPFNASEFDIDNRYDLKGYPLEPGEVGDNFTNVGYYTIEAHMKESAGNEYQGLALSDIAITIVATQIAGFENDSNGDTYDKDAEYPVIANTQAELNDAIASAQSGSDIPTKVVLPAGAFKLENGTAQNKNITISGTQDTVVTVVGDTGNQMNYQNGATLTFEGVTIQGQTAGNYGGIAHVAETTFVNCTIEGKLTLYGDATFTNCTFNNDSDYAIWTWGAKNAKFVGCTFNSGGKAVLLYGGAGSTEAPTTNLTVTNCTFSDNDTLTTDKAAIEIGNDYNAVYNLTVNNVTVNGFAVNPEGTSTGSTIWANKNSMDHDHLNVVIDGVNVY